VDLTVFADSDIQFSQHHLIDPRDLGANPVFEKAMKEADAFVGSLIFDYDDVLVVESLLSNVRVPVFSARSNSWHSAKSGLFP
jgi:magnesium chelatase subunit H